MVSPGSVPGTALQLTTAFSVSRVAYNGRVPLLPRKLMMLTKMTRAIGVVLGVLAMASPGFPQGSKVDQAVAKAVAQLEKAITSSKDPAVVEKARADALKN